MLKLIQAAARSVLAPELEQLATTIAVQADSIHALESELESALASRHELTLRFRHVLESASDGFLHHDSQEHKDLRVIAQALPYLLSGSQAWRGPGVPAWTAQYCEAATEVAAKYGFSLPSDPLPSVLACLALAQYIGCPGHSVQLELLRLHHPLSAAEVS